MNEVDELVGRLRQMIVGPLPHDRHGAVIDAVTKCAGDDLSSLELEVEFRDGPTGAKQTMRFGEVERYTGFDAGEADPLLLAQELAGMIVMELDEFLYAID